MAHNDLMDVGCRYSQQSQHIKILRHAFVLDIPDDIARNFGPIGPANMKLYSAEDVRIASKACTRNGKCSDYIEFRLLNYWSLCC